MSFFMSFSRWMNKPTRPGRSYQPMLEDLETREVPNASPFFLAHEFALASQALLGSASGNPGGCTGGPSQTQTTLTATLTGTSGSGTATFTSDNNNGTNSLVVQVSGLTPSTNYTVMSGSTTLGTISTDTSGGGSLSTSDVSPALTVGSTITVMDPNNVTALSGTLASATTGTTNTNLKAALAGATGTSGHARFSADTTSGNNELTVAVSGLSASSNFTVQVDGTTVGQLTTNANGSGRLSVDNVSQTIAAGSVVAVLDSTNAIVLQGTFTTAASLHGFGHHHHH